MLGLMGSAVLWVIFVGSILLSYAGLLIFMAIANVMSVNKSGWITLLFDSPKTWFDIFGFALPTTLQGLFMITVFLGLMGALLGFVVSRFRST